MSTPVFIGGMLMASSAFAFTLAASNPNIIKPEFGRRKFLLLCLTSFLFGLAMTVIEIFF